jgi:arsenate reductase (thioredoxin)
MTMNSSLQTTETPAAEPSRPARRHVTDYDRLIDELAYTYAGVFSRDSIAQAVADARAALEPTATIADFLPILVSRFAREQLTAAAQADGRIAKPVPEVLFVCIHNAGRSQMAAALAQHLSAGKVHVRSAGSQPPDQINPMAIQVVAERGITLTEAYPKPLTNDVVHAADVIVTMGCGDTCPIYPGKRYLDWDVPDPNDQPIDRVRDIRDDLQARITALLRDLNI